MSWGSKKYKDSQSKLTLAIELTVIILGVYMQNLCRKFAILSTFVSLSAFGSIQNLVESEKAFVAKEFEYLTCLVGHPTNSENLRAMFVEAKSDLAELVQEKVYEDLDQAACSQEQLDTLRIQLMEIAQRSQVIKTELGIETGIYSDKAITTEIGSRQEDDYALFELNTAQYKECPDVMFDRMTLNDRDVLHAFYLTYGHSCTAKVYKESSWADSNNRSYQEALDRELEKTLADYDKDTLKDINIAIVPSLVYERRYTYRVKFFGKLFYGEPTEGKASQEEQITMSQLCGRLKDYGAKSCKVMHRVTTEPMDIQAAETWEGLTDLAQKDGDFVIISQSAGAHVMNYILKQYPREHLDWLKANGLKAIYNIGGTPRGSSIAEYKAAPDYFIEREIGNTFGLVNGAGGFRRWAISRMAGIFSFKTTPSAMKRFWDLIRASLDIENVLALGHSNQTTLFSPDELSDESFRAQMPMYNLISLVDDMADLTPSTDPVLLHQMMYGPSEGSSLLADAAIEGKYAKRVFINKDHLHFFRVMTSDELTHINIAAIKSSMDLGLFEEVNSENSQEN